MVNEYLPRETLRLVGGPLDGEVHDFTFNAGKWGFYYETGEYNYPGKEPGTMDWTDNGKQGR